jgi:hypothetical protein
MAAKMWVDRLTVTSIILVATHCYCSKEDGHKVEWPLIGCSTLSVSAGELPNRTARTPRIALFIRNELSRFVLDTLRK